MQRLTRTTTRALAAFLEAPGSWRYGYELMKVAEVSSGTLYPLLARLTEGGWLEARWEDSALPGKPARQLYRLTATGRAEARLALERAEASWLRPPRPREV
ncbi:MAG: helix-turn-helix transcriptional regulator [Gemmatimonadetes bacterium]|nr:helix-turn-helix transcriptional regulator [Gemmatimonadota bacterium]